LYAHMQLRESAKTETSQDESCDQKSQSEFIVWGSISRFIWGQDQ